VIQDADNEAILEPHTATTYDPESGERAVEAVEDALRETTATVPNPVGVNLAGDVLDEEVEHAPSSIDASYPTHRPAPDPEKVESVLDLLRDAEAPVVLAGEGVVRADASDALSEFAAKTDTPVVTSINGKGAVDETEPYAVGVVGRWGFCEVANEAVENADLVVGLGVRFGDLSTVGRTLLPDGAEVVHVDLDAEWLGKNYDADVAVMADLCATIDAIAEGAEGDEEVGGDGERIERLSEDRQEWRESYEDKFTSEDSPVLPQRVMTELNRLVPPDGVLVSATSYSGFFSGAFYDVEEPGLGYLQARGSDGINVCLPQAIGVQKARPDDTVVALSGDGGIGYHIADLETAAREDLPLTVVVMNNDGLGSSKASQIGTDNFQYSVDFHEGVDYAAVARGFGCEGVKVEEADAFSNELEGAIEGDEPTLIDVQVAPFELPPIIVDG
jgi:acetolactate synthase-1/2/3 large subunit